MTVLKLVNNSWDESTRNLCFVNTSLQLLYSLPEVRTFFVNQEYKINQHESANLKICNEVSRIFKTAGQFTSSAATLRFLVGCESQNEDICSGSQQDITLFLRHLIQQIEIELAELDGPQALFMNKFWGREHVTKKFINSSDGTCNRCKRLPRQETEDFNMLKLESVITNNSVSLSTMIQDSFSEGTDILKMKCSDCCPHTGVCPLTGMCKQEDAVTQKKLFKSPDFLFIHLLRFSNFSDMKIQTLVVPEEILTLSNGDTYKLVSIADHIGDLIRNGHYVANIKTEQGWIVCDDDKQYKIREPISSKNYIFLYCKIEKSDDEKSNENNRDQFVKPKKIKRDISCQNCKQQIVSLHEHFKNNLICKQVFELKQCHVKLPKIKFSSKEEPDNAPCKNCGMRVNDIDIHYRTSVICGQTQSSGNYPDVEGTQNSISMESKRKNKIKVDKLVKCLSCGKEFVDLQGHLSKSFTCQVPYDIDDKIEKSFEHKSNDYECTPSLPKKRKIQPKKPCNGCQKSVINILLHLKRSKTCQNFYDIREEEEKHKKQKMNMQNEKKRKSRAARDELKKKADNEKDKYKKAEMRESRDELKKKADNEKQKIRDRERRETRDELKKKADNEKQKNRDRDRRETRDELKKKADNEKAKYKMAEMRESRDELKKKADNEKAKHKMAEMRESRDELKKKADNEKQKIRDRERRETRDELKKKADNEKAKHKMAEMRESRDELKKKADNEKDKYKMAEMRESRDELKKKADNEKDKLRQREYRRKQLLENPDEYRYSVAQNKANSRNNQVKTEEGRRKLFFESVKFGPIFGCVSCHRLCFDISVVSLSHNFIEDIEECHPGIFTKAIGSFKPVKPVHGKYHLCLTCKKYIFKGKVPPMSHKNNLEVFDTTDFNELLLSELEQCLIARNLLFMKMHQLPKSRMAGVKDRLVNVPVHEDDVINTVESLPRTPKEAGIVPIKLKRKKEYKNTHKEEYVSVPKIKKALKTLKSLGHKYYQFVNEFDIDNYEKRCQDLDDGDLEFLFGQTESEANVLVENLKDEILEEVDDLNEKEIEEYLLKDSVAKFQFDYNRNTCFANDIPEINVNEETEEGIAIAPGEGKIPKDILQDKDWDMRAFPALDPEGKNSLNCNREVNLSAQQFFQQRIFNINRRFANTASFVFAAVQFIENKQLTGNINIAFNRGRATRTEDGGTSYTLDDPYSVLDNIKNTPRYLKKKKNEFIAKLENHGPFQFFFTLSCADMRYEENFTSLLQDHNIRYETVDGIEQCFIDGMTLEDFLKANQNKHEFIRQNILTATRNFDHRVKNFIKTIVMSKFNEMHVEFYNYRVEFQMRGAAHIHGVLWIDFDAFLKDDRNKEFCNLKEAFEAIGNESVLSADQQNVLKRFADKFITCSLKDPSTRDIVQQVNIHHHTRACRKIDCQICRFQFPRFPTNETLISVPAKIKFKDEEEREKKLYKAKQALQKVKSILTDEDAMKELENEFPVDMTLTADKNYVNEIEEKRLFALLLKSDIAKILEVEENILIPGEMRKDHFKTQLIHEYKELLKISTGGYKIVHRRDIDELYVNNYNKEWIKCWNSNMDIQLTLDHFAIITYITDYMLKDDTGTMKFIMKAIKDAENQQLRERLKIVKNTFLTHRQIGEAEAYYRLIPSFHLTGSNCTTQFIFTGFRKNRSIFLKLLSEEQAKNYPKDKLITLASKPGKFFVKAESIEDRYDNRHPDLQKISLSQFAKRLTKSNKSIDSEEEKLFEKGTEVLISEESKLLNEERTNTNDIKDDFIIAFDKQDRKELKERYTVEKVTMRRRKPLVLRFYKFKQTKDPHQYYFSQLRLYHPHTTEELDAWEADFDTCKNAYDKAKPAIDYVKSKVMKYHDKVESAQDKAQEEFDNCMGDILDSTKEQLESDCLDEGIHDSDLFQAPDPSDFLDNGDIENVPNDNFFKRIELDSIDTLSSETQKLDPDQRSVVDIGVSYAQNLMKLSNMKSSYKLKAPLVVVQGGAGCGKSFVINLMTQWQERILRKSGDDPNNPYILKCAFTGTAASIIQGQTLHHTFSFSFGNDFFSLNDKTRDARRMLLKNLKILVIDEYSMVKADMLYLLDLRLKELMENYDEVFGGVAIFLFGDLLQLKPTCARYIFQEPSNEQFHISHALDSLWERFEVINLTYNHRQGGDKIYADSLNRMRVGETTEEDIKLLESRVIAIEDSRLPKEAIFLSAINEDVNKINEDRLELLDSKLLTISAVVSHKNIKKRKPIITSAGNIRNTPLQYILKLKIGARVMLTHNLDVSDGLTNGALGEVIDYDISQEGRIQRIYVEFYNDKVGKEWRKKYPSLLKRFPNKKATPINKIEYTFSESKKSYSSSAPAIALQYPLKLAWAITAHKIQGQTVATPLSLVVDMTKVFEAAQTYVMLSRVQELNQLYIVKSVMREKIYPDVKALAEYEQMKLKALKRKHINNNFTLKITSLNIRSLKKHMVDLISEPQIQNSDVVLVQQTCLKKDEPTNIYELTNYNSYFNSYGDGRGIALYFKNNFDHNEHISKHNYQISKVQSPEYDIICVYRSSDSVKSSQINFLIDLRGMISEHKKTLILGDFNCNAFCSKQTFILEELETWNFTQILREPTHIQGGLIDHCYVSKNIPMITVSCNQKSVYYTDHDIIDVRIKENLKKITYNLLDFKTYGIIHSPHSSVVEVSKTLYQLADKICIFSSSSRTVSKT